MTRKQVTAGIVAPVPAAPTRSQWRLQDAKARFSELARRAHSDGPQHVTLHGRDAVVVLDAGTFARLQGERTGELDIAPRRAAMPVRAVSL